jgi:branched-chain amino acid transport system ATP-binding protein
MSILTVKDIESGYGEVQILWGLSMELQPGKLTTLVGSNGSGKTTLLRSVTGLVRPWKGSVMFEGKDITRLSPHEKAEMGLVLVPEARQLFTDMTVLENLEMGATPKAARAEFKQTLDWVYTLLPRLKERQTQIAGTLSGGEQQMVAIARGLMAKPKVLMFDELSLGLSPLLVINLFEVLLKLKSQGLTMLAVSDYAYVLNNGRVETQGDAKKVREMESVRKAYLGL